MGNMGICCSEARTKAPSLKGDILGGEGVTIPPSGKKARLKPSLAAFLDLVRLSFLLFKLDLFTVMCNLLYIKPNRGMVVSELFPINLKGIEINPMDGISR